MTWALWELEWGWGCLKAAIVTPLPPDCLGPKIEQELSDLKRSISGKEVWGEE